MKPVTDEQTLAIAKEITAGLASVQAKRQPLLDNNVGYWRQMATNPDDQWYDTDQVRKHGQLTSVAGEDAEMAVSINYIAQELLNMVASDVLTPLKYRVVLKQQAAAMELSLPGESAPVENLDKYEDRVKDIIDHYLSPCKLNLDDVRKRLYLLRYMEGSGYLTLDWDGDGGNILVHTRRKTKSADGEEKWNVVTGDWSKDGQFYEIPQPARPGEPVQHEDGTTAPGAPVPQPPLRVPRDEFYGGGEYEERAIAQGDPRVLVYGTSQVWWDVEPGEVCGNRVRGVWIVDFINRAQVQQDYKKKIIYGEETDFNIDDVKGVGDAISKAVTWIKARLGMNKDDREQPFVRIRYRRKPRLHMGEYRSQWFTVLGNELVKAEECPYGRTFDVSLGVYPFFDRPDADLIEGKPSVAYMIPPQRLVNAFDSMILDYMEGFPYGVFFAPGGSAEEIKTNVTGGPGPKIVTANRMLTPGTPTPLGQEVFTEKNDMRYLIQYFGRANQLQVGSRSQDADTATQAQIQQAYGQKLTNYNQKLDAISWSWFLNDLKTMLGDPRLVTEQRTVVGIMQDPRGRELAVEFKMEAALFDHVHDIYVEPEDLQNKTAEEEKRDIVAVLSMLNPADPFELDLVRKLKKRYLELANLPGIVYPEQQVIAPGTPSPGDEVGGEEATLAAVDGAAPAGTENLTRAAQAQIGQIAQQ